MPICGKFLEKIVFVSFLNRLNIKNSTGFRPGDSTIYQLISITSDICTSFENHDETGYFLDISKAFHKVWYVGLIHKLQCGGIAGNLFIFFKGYLKNRNQRVVLNGLHSEWSYPRGLSLVLSFFSSFTNELTDNISSQIRLFANDSSLLTSVNGVDQTH